MHPDKARHDQIDRFTDLPNIGPALARDFARLGYSEPRQLAGLDACRLYRDLCELTGKYHDPCVLDVFLSVSDFLAGHPARAWWHYTPRRKRHHGAVIETARKRYRQTA